MNNENIKRGVLFDLDGVLVLTEQLKAQAHAATITAFCGNVPAEFYTRIMGQSHGKVREAFLNESGLEIDPEAYSNKYTDLLRHLMLTQMQTAQGGPELLARLKESGHVLALVTSSIRWMMETALSLTGLGKFFDATICADDVQREKPAPDPYLLALKHLDLPANNAVIIEDSETGIAAAKAAGVPVIAIRHHFNIYHDFSDADAIVDSLKDTDEIARLIEEILMK